MKELNSFEVNTPLGVIKTYEVDNGHWHGVYMDFKPNGSDAWYPINVFEYDGLENVMKNHFYNGNDEPQNSNEVIF